MASIRKRSWRPTSGETKSAWALSYRDQNGKRRQATFKTRKAAEQHRATYIVEIREGTHTPASETITVAEAAERWLKRAEREDLELSTVRAYRNLARYHVVPVLGSVKLSKLTVPLVTDFRSRLLDGRVSAITEPMANGRTRVVIEADHRRSRLMAKRAVGALSMILGNALAEGLVAQNVVLSMGRQRGGRSEARDKERLEAGRSFPTREDVKAMIDAASRRWRPLVIVAAFCGLRSSELRGLRWEDVDFQARVIRVRQRADRWNVMGPPKSKAGRREIPLGGFVLNTLREWKLACPKGEAGLVFPNSRGRVDPHSNIANRGIGAVQIRAGLIKGYRTDKRRREVPVPKYSLHCLRHFCASVLIDQGFAPKRIQQIMGHSSIQMSFDLYGHLFALDASDHERLDAAELRVIGGE